MEISHMDPNDQDKFIDATLPADQLTKIRDAALARIDLDLTPEAVKNLNDDMAVLLAEDLTKQKSPQIVIGNGGAETIVG
jgi:hypothetical protein